MVEHNSNLPRHPVNFGSPECPYRIAIAMDEGRIFGYVSQALSLGAAELLAENATIIVLSPNHKEAQEADAFQVVGLDKTILFRAPDYTTAWAFQQGYGADRANLEAISSIEAN
jgi:hypothetical protein